ncbi:MAG: cobalamin-independent methionine synthase II family protein [Sphingomonadales bacterium]|nr:cobalamin-independent methionine synthase II family protein [Sphingomonadales bacterium]
MKALGERILTTHVGSLCRPAPLLEMVIDQVAGNPVDPAAFEAEVAKSVQYVVARQAEVGVDIPSDGEFSKPDFHNYIVKRLGGLEVQQVQRTPAGSAGMYYPKLDEEFPGFMKQYGAMYRTMWLPPEIPRDKIDKALNAAVPRTVVTRPISYEGQAELQRDLKNFKQAMAPYDFADAFVPAATPSRSDAIAGDIYKSEEEYLYALADAMHEEYKAIVDAGYMVQLDLGLPSRNQVLYGKTNPTVEELRRASEMQVEAYNHALRGIPTDRVRYHLCWGSMNTPHTTDVPLTDFIELILKINAGFYVLEGANPRHEHEWMVWKDVKLPQDKVLVPGVVSHQTNVVEHPELISWRIQNYASVVGRDRVIAGTDCGFSQGWTMQRVHEEVQWAKLKAMADGAALATKALWG